MKHGRADHESDSGAGDEDDEGGFSKRDSLAYQGALEAAFAIPIAGVLGWWLDTKFETTPWLMLIGLVAGFGACVRRIWKMRALVEAASQQYLDDERH